MMTDANFMYAASAKRAQIENNDGSAGRSFQAAMSRPGAGAVWRGGGWDANPRNERRSGATLEI